MIMSTSHDDALALPGFAERHAARADRRPADVVRNLRSCLRHWQARYRERAFLAGLGDFELSRLGLTPGQRDAEAGKAFWER